MSDSHSAQDPARPANQTKPRRLLGCDKVLAVHVEQLKFDFSRVPGGPAVMLTDPSKPSGEATCSLAVLWHTLWRTERALEEYDRRGWLRRLTSHAALYESVDAGVNEVAEGLLLFLPDEMVSARVPLIRADLQRYFTSSDPRYDKYTAALNAISPLVPITASHAPLANNSHQPEVGESQTDRAAEPPAAVPVAHPVLTSTDRASLRELQHSLNSARASNTARVRTYRNMLIGATLLLLIVCGGLIVILPFTAVDLGIIRPPDFRITAGDVATIELWGAVGGVVGLIAALRKIVSTRAPIRLQAVQLFLKLPAGAIIALFGVLIFQAGVFTTIKIATPTQLAAYALIFGLAQEAVTNMVDKEAGKLLEQSKSTDEAAADS
jgi:hypothetical protein